MKRDWKPGDVAMVSVARRIGNDDPTEYIAFYAGPRYGWYGVTDGEGCGGLTDNHEDFYIHRRPLVVIDPEDREQVEKLRDLIFHAAPLGQVRVASVDVQAALREFANPKPEEPTRLGAVVEDADGTKWLRHDSVAIYRRWLNTDACVIRYRSWDELNAVRVLSEGVQP